ncbi:g4502 [Coccomyxa elongata]
MLGSSGRQLGASSGPATLPPLGLQAACPLLLQDYQAFFSRGGPPLPSSREGTIGPGLVYPLGSFFPLEGFDEVVKQMLRRLLKLNSSSALTTCS